MIAGARDNTYILRESDASSYRKVAIALVCGNAIGKWWHDAPHSHTNLSTYKMPIATRGIRRRFGGTGAEFHSFGSALRGLSRLQGLAPKSGSGSSG